MFKLFNTVGFRLAIGYGAVMIGAVAVISTILYIGTVGVLTGEIDTKIQKISERLSNQFETRGLAGVQQGINELLTDGIDYDTEEYLLVGPEGAKMVGNLSGWDGPLDRSVDRTVVRYGRESNSRLFARKLPNGATLVVGRDMQDMLAIKQLVFRSILAGGGVAVVFAVGGAILFRSQLERRVAAIRHTVLEIEAGDLSRRIPVMDANDEFSRLNQDINHMLDQIQRLMDGVRNVSNAIAHDLRTPLGRIRGSLDQALRPDVSKERLAETASAAIRGIDELIVVFDKLLQIAEAESGTRRQSFREVDLRNVIMDVVELYDAVAEAKGARLLTDVQGEPTALGDKDLLASATANLIDNAVKYAGNTPTLMVRAEQHRDTVSIVVQDNGPGIPSEERERVMSRFYRGDRSRTLPGNGLGLPIVGAICHLHNGRFSLEDANPGLIARIVLPGSPGVGLPSAQVTLEHVEAVTESA